jgi:hypothetical protein
VTVEPRWFYLLRAWLSGEAKEFKANAPVGVRFQTDWTWLNWYRNKVVNLPQVKTLLEQS